MPSQMLPKSSSHQPQTHGLGGGGTKSGGPQVPYLPVYGVSFWAQRRDPMQREETLSIYRHGSTIALCYSQMLLDYNTPLTPDYWLCWLGLKGVVV